jgi:thiamine-phosphate pyrophosphorylase
MGRIYLFTPLLTDASDFIADLEAALDMQEVAALLVRSASPERQALERRIEALAPTIQGRGVALLVDGGPETALRTGADGAHCRDPATLEAALRILKPQRIVGVGGLTTRHDAMVAGEAGADYVMFGEPDATGRRPGIEAVAERVGWWAELFEVPCVAYAGNVQEAGRLAASGADFIATDVVWSAPEGPAAGLRTLVEQLRAMESAE